MIKLSNLLEIKNISINPQRIIELILQIKHNIFQPLNNQIENSNWRKDGLPINKGENKWGGEVWKKEYQEPVQKYNDLHKKLREIYKNNGLKLQVSTDYSNKGDKVYEKAIRKWLLEQGMREIGKLLDDLESFYDNNSSE